MALIGYTRLESQQDGKWFGYAGTPFTIQVKLVANKPGQWESSEVTVYLQRPEDAAPISVGSYRREYPSYVEQTFCPFSTEDGTWYALYSHDYNTLSLARLTGGFTHLHSLNDHFCPVEVGVPFIYEVKNADGEWRIEEVGWDAKEMQRQLDRFSGHPCEGNHRIRHADFGFYSGCVWGDDSSWKLRFIDLREVPNGKIVFDDKPLGYFPMADLTLRDSVPSFWVSDTMVQFHAIKEMIFRRSISTEYESKGQETWKNFED